MPNHAENIQSNNYTLTKLVRIGISPLSAMIGISSYYSQVIGNPILGAINSFLFAKKLGIDIWNLNQKPTTKTKLFNSSKKILLGLGTISLANYSRFTNNIIEPIILPTTTSIPIISTSTTMTPYTTSTTTLLPWSTLYPASTVFTTTTDIPPWPTESLPIILMSNNSNNQLQMDWDTYISLNSYGISNLIAGITELIPNRFKTIRKIANMATGGALFSTGVAMGINNNFINAYAIPTITAGVSEIIHNLLPMEINHNIQEMQETTFTHNTLIDDETVRLINNIPQDYERQQPQYYWDNNDVNLINNQTITNYGSISSMDDSLTSDILQNRLHNRQPIYCSTTIPL